MTPRAKVLLRVLVAVLLLEGALVGSWLYATRSRTEYAARFNESVFQALPEGLSATEVVQRLGEPLSRRSFTEGDVVWYYTRPLGKNFTHRALVFDRKNTLIKKASFEIAD